MTQHEPLAVLLDRTRAALIAGDLAALPALTVATEAALAGWRPANGAELTALAAAAERNARCLSAAGAGLRAARSRLAEIAAAGRSIGYDVEGRRVGLPAPATLARRF